MNRERTFWVYKHQLFHRDRPEELHLLRRRTCPGVDGRKQRLDTIETPSPRAYSPRPSTRRSSISTLGDQSDESAVLTSTRTKRKSRTSDDVDMKKSKRKAALDLENEADHDYDSSLIKPMVRQVSPSSVMVNVDLMNNVASSDEYKGPSGLTKRIVSPIMLSDAANRDRSSSFEQSILVSKVARKLEEHAKRAAAAKRSGLARRGGTITPPFFSDNTMMYNALTYDDEFEIYDSVRGCVVDREEKPSVVADLKDTFSIISNDDGDDEGSIKNFGNEIGSANEKAIVPPVDNKLTVSNIVRKISGWARQSALPSKVDGQLAAAILGFCMLTHPRDDDFEDKFTELLFACGSLVTEFRRYKAALLPGSLPPESLTSKTTRLEMQIKQLFAGDKADTVRVFKVFLLNSLEELVNDSDLMKNIDLEESEIDSMNHCYKIWLKSLRQSA